MSFPENFTLRNFLAIQYACNWTHLSVVFIWSGHLSLLLFPTPFSFVPFTLLPFLSSLFSPHFSSSSDFFPSTFSPSLSVLFHFSVPSPSSFSPTAFFLWSFSSSLLFPHSEDLRQATHHSWEESAVCQSWEGSPHPPQPSLLCASLLHLPGQRQPLYPPSVFT